MNLLDLFHTAHQMAQAGLKPNAVTLYKEWIAANPETPGLHAAQFNLGVLLMDLGDNHGALCAFNESMRLQNDFMPAVISLGSALERLDQTDMAIDYWTQAVGKLSHVSSENISYKLTAIQQLARVLQSRHEHATAEEMLRLGLDVGPHQREMLQHWVSLRQRQCKWPVVQPTASIPASRLVSEMAPLTQVTYTDDPLLHLANAYHYNKNDVGWPQEFRTSAHFKGKPPRQKARRRIGYISSDLRAHAIGYLMAEMFSLHDRDQFEIFVFFCGFQALDPIMLRIQGSVDHWIDINGIDDAKVASMIEDMDIDILIDVNGNTRDARTRMLARRPAPIIANWLGFPGTMGSPYHHYIIADSFIIPPQFEKYYSEKVVRLPCYQPNDRTRVVAPPPTRAQHGLPDGKVVFCCFNGTQKITKFAFSRWMEILRRVDGSVLWMLKAGQEADVRMKQLAAEQGIDPERLIISQFMGNAEHMARYALADLFLDSTPYGAHTTASDALWMGVPVITSPGRSFASRVCGSLVHAAGLPDFICNGPDAYVELAVRLGNDPAAIADAKHRLSSQRDQCTLFDTALLVRSLEQLFRDMWQDWEQDRLPVPNLTNVELYGEIGASFDHEAEEFSFVADYEERYRARLAHRDAFTPLPPDGRLWPPG